MNFALDWFRMVYAYDLPMNLRKIYYGLQLERSPHPPNHQLIYERNVFWLSDALNPHDIVDESYQDVATARYDVHTRFVVHAIVRCFWTSPIRSSCRTPTSRCRGRGRCT